MSAGTKPMPDLDGPAGAFYGFCRDGELRFQRCTACGRFRHVPREMCAVCGSFDVEWAPSTGRGRLFSYTIVARALHPAFVDDAPYSVVVVEMDEGVRLLSRVADVPPDALAIGMPLEVVFERVSDDVTLPRFRRAAP